MVLLAAALAGGGPACDALATTPAGIPTAPTATTSDTRRRDILTTSCSLDTAVASYAPQAATG
jgi:hypothetical protein